MIRFDKRGMGLSDRGRAGTLEQRMEELAVIAVNFGARIAAAAGAGEVVVSSTVRDLVAGSGLTRVDRGEHSLKGVARTLATFGVARQAPRDAAGAKSTA